MDSEYTSRNAGRNGSPFAADRSFRRPVSNVRRAFLIARDVLALAGLVGLIFAAASAWSASGSPNLTGYGCEGFDRPIRGYEESDFPVCRAIVRNP